MNELPVMTSAEATAVRHLIGLTFEQLGDALGINPRSIRRWESGSSAPGAGVASALRELRAEHDADTKRLAAEAFTSSVVLIPSETEARPAGWWKAVAARLIDRMPEARVAWAE